MQELKQSLKDAVKALFNEETEPELSRPEEPFGDYSTNVAMQLAGKLGKSPREIAEGLAEQFKESKIVAKTEVAGPGFINFWLTDEALWQGLKAEPAKKYANQTIVAEYSDPNPFKILHAGHLYTSVVGDALANLYEAAGAKVHRVNFGGDVGRHVAITMWAILDELAGENPEKLSKIPITDRSNWLSKCYIKGTQAFEENESVRAEVTNLNKQIYQIHEHADHESPLAQIYWTTRQWSYDYFDEFYESIGTKFEKYYPESETAELGLKTVKGNIGKVFEESDGAIVFKGEVHNMHTRVFINSQGLPTYEAKDVGLILKKWQDYHFDKSIVITGNEIYEYMQVVLKAVEQFAPDLVKRTVHLTHGLVKLVGGEKMSSRKGNILRATDVLEAAASANQKVTGQTNPAVELGAVKYAFLKQRIGPDIIYDPKESVSLQGNSGPYLQYAYVRANSILSKVVRGQQTVESENLESGERSLARKLSEYPEVVEKATEELLPSHICTYLYELAQIFNRFYENNRVIGNERQAIRLSLISAYSHILKSGLELLNIPVVEKM